MFAFVHIVTVEIDCIEQPLNDNVVELKSSQWWFLNGVGTPGGL